MQDKEWITDGIKGTHTPRIRGLHTRPFTDDLFSTDCPFRRQKRMGAKHDNQIGYKGQGFDSSGCGGLNENGPQWPVDLNTWSLGSSTISRN